MIRKTFLGLALVLILFSLAGAIPPAPTGGHVVAPSTPSFTLTVTKPGSGSGTVTAAGINCGSTCDEDYIQNTIVFLFAAANVGSTFSGWGGACTGTGSCQVTMSQARAVTATFSLVTVTANRFFKNNGLTTGNCSNSGTGTDGACTVRRFLQVIQCGETGMGLNGTYQGADNMMDTYAFPPTNTTCSSGSQITIFAESDGGVFFDGQFSTSAFNVYQLTYWNFTGFDSGNTLSGSTASTSEFPLWVASNNHVSVRRHCASNTQPGTTGPNRTVFVSSNNTNSTFEDICAFGWGRLMFYTSDLQGSNPHSGNKFRRMWMRSEGFIGGGVGGEPEYYHTDSPALNGNDLYENLIWIYDWQQNPTDTAVNVPGINRQGYSLPDTKLGWIFYGRTGAPSSVSAWYKEDDASWVTNFVDLFVDARSQATKPINMACTPAGGAFGPNPDPAKCASNSADRITSLLNPSGTPSSFGFANTTNTNECTNIANCPNFYTGVGQGSAPSAVGARNCFEYQDGTLTSTKLWPWRMDDRIKAALARANAAGTGGSALLGSAGSGYAANTVTSEIVSRYGSVPAGCLR